jgi:hypothetical protein
MQEYLRTISGEKCEKRLGKYIQCHAVDFVFSVEGVHSTKNRFSIAQTSVFRS